MPTRTRPPACELCGRETILTRHHLIPRTRHRNRRVRQHFGRDEMQGRILWLCTACHHHVHLVLSEKELALEFNTREALLGHPDIRRFVRWIGARPAGFKPRFRR